MGLFINTGKADFETARRSEYVDKSMLIAYVNRAIGTQNKFMCVTRARRFGKSMAAKMLNAYYDESVDAAPLFHDLKIAHEPSYNEHRNKYPVIYLDVSGFTGDLNTEKHRVVHAINDALSKELIRTYPKADIDASEPLAVQFFRAFEYTHKQFIMIIDEWDAVLRELEDDAIKRTYLDWLRTLFKNSQTNTVFAGVYMTGILPIKQYNTESALNNFEEFSMVNPGALAGCFGFTKEEVHALSQKYGMDEALIQQWYDGYQIGELTDIYNPYAVMRAMQRKRVETYWTASAAYEGLLGYLKMNFDGLQDAVLALLAGDAIKVDISRFSNDIHEINNSNIVLALLVHLGYLAYNNKSQTAYIPNQEVRSEFEKNIQETNWKHIANTLKNSDQLL